MKWMHEEERAEWRAGWTLPVICAICYAIGAVYLHSFSVFIAPVEHEFGWGRAEVSAALLAVSVSGIIITPLLGSLIDRFGTRRVAIPAMILYCAGLSSLALVKASPWAWQLTWLLIGIGASGVNAMVWSVAVASRFDKSRGLALAVTLIGSSIGASLAPLLANELINGWGWRGAYARMGLILASIGLPLAYFFLYDALDHKRRQGDAQKKALRSDNDRGALRASLLSGKFIRLALSGFAVSTAMMGILVHFVPILTSLGATTEFAAHAAALLGVGSVIGRLLTGFLLDRVHGTIVGAGGFLLPALAAMLLLMVGHHAYGMLISSLILGISIGSEMDALAYLASRYFGTRNFGLLFGVIVACQQISVGLGPATAGFLYDLNKSYHFVLMLAIPIFCVSAFLVATLGRYADEDEKGYPLAAHI